MLNSEQSALFTAIKHLLPATDPARRLECYLAMDFVLDELHRGRVIDYADAPRIAMVSKLPLLSVRAAIRRLERHAEELGIGVC